MFGKIFHRKEFTEETCNVGGSLSAELCNAVQELLAASDPTFFGILGWVYMVESVWCFKLFGWVSLCQSQYRKKIIPPRLADPE